MKINLPNYFCILIPLLLIVTGCAEELDKHDHPANFTGEDYYNAHCSKCHKKSGLGQVLHGVPPVIYTKKTHSKLRKFMMHGVDKDDKAHKFVSMPKKEARKISRHISKLLKNKLDE